MSKRGNEARTEVANRHKEYSWNLDSFGEIICKVGFSTFSFHSLAPTHNVYPTKIKLSVETGV